MHASGQSVRAIAAAVGVSKSLVDNIVSPGPQKGWQPARLFRLVNPSSLVVGIPATCFPTIICFWETASSRAPLQDLCK